MTFHVCFKNSVIYYVDYDEYYNGDYEYEAEENGGTVSEGNYD